MNTAFRPVQLELLFLSSRFFFPTTIKYNTHLTRNLMYIIRNVERIHAGNASNKANNWL